MDGGRNKRSKTKKFNLLMCAPNRKRHKTRRSCYSKSSINHIKNAWNLKYPHEAIKETNYHRIWKILKNKMMNACKNERCWLNQEFMKNRVNKELLTYTFAPKQPIEWKNNPNTWLSNTDIKDVMAQYEHVYKKFMFIGPTPIDYDTRVYRNKCVWQELCELKLKSIHGKKDCIGIVFNQDVHTGPGTHWVAMIIHLKHQYICYFDSLGKPPKPSVSRLIENVTNQGIEIGIKFEYIENTKKHQKENSECGVYSMYFLTQSLFANKEKVKRLCTSNIPDKEMERLRNVFYNK